MTRIDAHHHVWRPRPATPAAETAPRAPRTASGPSRRPHDWLNAPDMAALRRDFTLDDLAPEAAAAGIDPTGRCACSAASYTEVVRAAEEVTERLTAAERAEVFGGTAARAY